MSRPCSILPLVPALLWCAGLPGSAQPAPRPELDAYRRFALTHEGDVAGGARLFADDQKLACAKCHSVDGRGGKAGPDLFAVGDKFGRRDLIDAVLLPSASYRRRLHDHHRGNQSRRGISGHHQAGHGRRD